MSETDLIKKRLEFLEDTIRHYNLHNRSADDNAQSCFYYPINSKSEGCAIGRRIKDKELCKELDSLYNPGVMHDEAFNKLPQELRELGQQFLVSIQDLHDFPKNWNESGLSDQGKSKAKDIIETFCTDYSNINE